MIAWFLTGNCSHKYSRLGVIKENFSQSQSDTSLDYKFWTYELKTLQCFNWRESVFLVALTFMLLQQTWCHTNLKKKWLRLIPSINTPSTIQVCIKQVIYYPPTLSTSASHMTPSPTNMSDDHLHTNMYDLYLLY